MTDKERYNELLHEVAEEDSPDERIKAIKEMITEYSNVLSDSQINGLKLNINLIENQKKKQKEQQKLHEQEIEGKINRYISNVKSVISPERYADFLSDMYTAYHTYGTTLVDFHIAMRCFNEQAGIMGE